MHDDVPYRGTASSPQHSGGLRPDLPVCAFAISPRQTGAGRLPWLWRSHPYRAVRRCRHALRTAKRQGNGVTFKREHRADQEGLARRKCRQPKHDQSSRIDLMVWKPSNLQPYPLISNHSERIVL